MRFLVTGSAGFIGFALSKKLLSQGHQVIGVDNHSDDYDISIKENHTNQLKSNPNFEFIRLDVVNDAFPSILNNKSVDYVVHLAAKDIYYQSEKSVNYSPFLVTNVIGTSKMFELAKKLSAKKFVYASTHSVYGNTKKERLTEKKILPHPISPHGASKMAAEQVLHFMSKFYELPTVVLRIFTAYGPEMRPHTVIPLIIDRLVNNSPIDIYHDADATRDFVYIDDVVNAIISVFNKRITFQIINIASGTSYSLHEVAQKIATIMGNEKAVEVTNHEKSFRKLLVKFNQADIARAKKILKFAPETSIDEGLKKTVDWYMKNPEILYKSTHHK